MKSAVLHMLALATGWSLHRPNYAEEWTSQSGYDEMITHPSLTNVLDI